MPLRRQSTCAAASPAGSLFLTRAPTSRAAKCCCARARGSARARSACWRHADWRRSRWFAVRALPCCRPATNWSSRAGRSSRPASMTATVPSSPPRLSKPAASRCRSARFPTRRWRSSWRCALRSRSCDLVVLSGGTSKGAGDLSHRVVSRLGPPGILVHGVALKPGKPLCLAVIGDKPLVVLPGFPTSAIFTFHAFVAPIIRARAGLQPEAARTVKARVPVRIASELGREEFVLVSLVAGDAGPIAFPTRQRFGRGHRLFTGRRISLHRCARDRARCRDREPK